MIRAVMVFSSAMALAGCPERADVCEHKWDGQSYLNLSYRGPTEVRFPRIKAKTIDQINQCYSEQPYQHNKAYELLLTEERALPTGEMLIIFDMNGVSDLRFGAIVDGSGHIKDIGLLSEVAGPGPN